MVIRCLWDGRAFHPVARSLVTCKELEVGPYLLSLEGDWSAESHNYYFARLHEFYENLPEDTAAQFKNIDHFRASCLIEEGFATEQCQIYENESTAQIAAKALARYAPYSVIVVSGPVLRVWTAKSQARGRMSKREFQKSTQAVLERAEFLVNGGELNSPDKSAAL